MKRRGFTVTEALVALAIILIFGGMLLPLTKHRNEPNKSQMLESPISSFSIGETVVIRGINKTGVVSSANGGVYVNVITTDSRELTVNRQILKRIYE